MYVHDIHVLFSVIAGLLCDIWAIKWITEFLWTINNVEEVQINLKLNHQV